MFNDSFAITIRDINYGKHLDHLSLLAYLHETRVRYLNSRKCSEDNIDGNNSKLIVKNLVCDYKKECFYNDTIDIGLEVVKESDFKLLFKYIVNRGGVIVATAVITTVFINSSQKLIRIPDIIL